MTPHFHYVFYLILHISFVFQSLMYLLCSYNIIYICFVLAMFLLYLGYSFSNHLHFPE